MTEHPSSDDDAFFEALAGRGTGHAGASALRAALRHEAEVIQLAESATTTPPTPDQVLARQRIRDALVAEGLLPREGEAPAGPASSHQTARADQRSGGAPPASRGRPPASSASVLANWLDWFRSWSAPQLAGLAASVVLGAVVLVRLGGTGDQFEPEDAMRGGQRPSLSVANPAAFGEALVGRINAEGGEATLVQLSDAAWVLSVNASGDAVLPKVQALLKQAGFTVSGLPPYEFRLLRAAPGAR